MPSYSYTCEKCNQPHEEFRSINKPHPDCPCCGAAYGKEFTQDYSECRVAVWAYGNPTTVGQQAEINAKRLGREQLDKKWAEEDRKYGKRANTFIPEWRQKEFAGKDMKKPLDISKVADVKKYIETGEGYE